MNRRHLLLAGAGATLLSGCLGGGTGTADGTGTTGATTDDCRAGYRPPEPAPDDEPPGAAARYDYPERPDALSGGAALDYLRAYERAFRLNELREEYGERLQNAGVVVYDEWRYDAPEGTVLGQVEYTYSYGYEEGPDGRVVQGDSPYVYASYFVDDAGVHRAIVRGHREEPSSLARDPRAPGWVVECF